MGEVTIKDLAQLVALFVSAGALVWAVWSYIAKSRLDHYTEIDRQYADIVKLRITYTELANPPDTLSTDLKTMGERDLRYDAYALLIWNFIETIHDRFKGDTILLETWQPILDLEGQRHAAWLSQNENKFKKDFLKWAHKKVEGLNKFIDGNGHPPSGAST
jgi:hypothetical protein